MLLVCEGHGTKVIGEKLGISEGAAKFHVCGAMRRLDADTRTLAAVRFTLLNLEAIRERVEC